MNRIIETVKGYEAAKAEVAGWVRRFNECNDEFTGQHRARPNSPSGLRAEDYEGSGEFCAAVCVNSETASSNADEIYNIEVMW